MSEKLNQMRIETHSKSAAHVARSTNNLGSPLAQRSCPMIDNMPRCKRVELTRFRGRLRIGFVRCIEHVVARS